MSNRSHLSSAIAGRTTTTTHVIGASTWNCVRLVIVRNGSVVLSGEFGQKPVNVGDIALLGAGVPCVIEPEGKATFTTVCLNPDYAIDLFYWQYTGLLFDRLEAEDIATTVFAEPVQVLRLSERRLREIEPLLEELVELSEAGNVLDSFTRMQALWFLVADTIRTLLTGPPVQEVIARRAGSRRGSIRHHPRLGPMRAEAIAVRDA